ncbi:transporter [Corynebacterium mayonis]|uniref:transporter n=1 Tax=Corynebacterium mayonis TaxID=3062461 RepID=UPI003140A898
MRKNYHISGPTHEAAVDSLIDEVNLVEGTQGVEVEAEKGVMAVTGVDFSDAHILAAVKAAGFTLDDDLAP